MLLAVEDWSSFWTTCYQLGLFMANEKLVGSDLEDKIMIQFLWLWEKLSYIMKRDTW